MIVKINIIEIKSRPRRGQMLIAKIIALKIRPLRGRIGAKANSIL